MVVSEYEQQLQAGAAEYADALNALRGAGLPCEFSQTGGMNAAIEVRLERGWVLVTDLDDALPWCRTYQRGWGVGYYTDQSWCEGPEEFVDSEDSRPEMLPALVEQCLGLVRPR
jgi:hypothetical protein